MNKKSLEEIMAMPKEMRYGYLYGMGANKLELQVVKSRAALEGDQIFMEYVKPFIEDKPNAVQVWLS